MGHRNQGDVGFSGELGTQSRSPLDSKVFEKSGREAAMFFGSAAGRLTLFLAVERRSTKRCKMRLMIASKFWSRSTYLKTYPRLIGHVIGDSVLFHSLR